MDGWVYWKQNWFKGLKTKSEIFYPCAHIQLDKNGDRIKGLKLRQFNAYLGGAAVDEAPR